MRHHNAFAAAVPFVLAVGAVALAADPQGPRLGNNRYSASIATVCAVPDTDDYVGSLLAGEKLNVSVVAAKGSSLLPKVTIVGPGGTESAPAQLAVSRNGRSVTIRAFPVPTTGRWAVRVAGAGGTQGAYSIAFSIVPAKPVTAKKLEVNGGADCVVPFEGFDGARVDLTVTWRSRKSPVTLVSIEDPSRRWLQDVVPVVRGTSFSVKGLVLGGGSGSYKLHLGRGTGTPVCDVSVRVTPPARAASARTVKLADSEPYLDPLDAPVRGIAARSVRLSGGNFSAEAPPTVLFGAKPAISYVVSGGKAIDVLPPEMADGSTVSVAVIGADGQSCVRDSYFHYVPLAVVQDLVDDHDASVRVVAAAGGTTLFLRGTGFETGQSVLFGTVPVASANVTSATRYEVVTPPAFGRMRLYVTDDFGRTGASAFEIQCVAPAEITSVAATGGAFLDASHVAAGGGARVVLSGANFLASDRVTLGGAPCTVDAATGDTLTFTTAATRTGLADLVVTDVLGETTTVAGALHVVGWADATDLRSPGKSAADALTASRGAVGDLDGDGTDDLVLVSSATSPGDGKEFTRVFLSLSGELTDATATNFPAAKSDPAGADEWKASAVALGDLDDSGSLDIVIGGWPVAAAGGGFLEARIFANDTGGTFVRDGASPKVRTAPWIVTDAYYGGDYALLTPLGTNGGQVTALAMGDIDGDGAVDIVMGTDHFRTGTLHVPLDNVTFSGDSATAYGVSGAWSPTGTTIDTPALRIFSNRRGSGAGFVDETFARLPRGEQSPGRLPAYHVRDLALGDVNGDGFLDIVLTWDDPTSVTPYGRAHPGAEMPRVATRVLLNDGTGSFTDATDTWMPAGSADEYWQADRLVLKDIDGDGDLDLVLLHHESVDAYTGSASHSRTALRVLGNVGTAFVDMTATAVPAVPLAGTNDDNLRGTALAVFDFDGDGLDDILVGTTESFAGGTARSTRLLRGHVDLVLSRPFFTDASAFLPVAASDSGEANDIVTGDLAGDGVPSILLLTDTHPAKSAGGENLRVLDWTK